MHLQRPLQRCRTPAGAVQHSRLSHTCSETRLGIARAQKGSHAAGNCTHRRGIAAKRAHASITAPVQVASDKKLSGQQASPAPFWSTFCGCTNGVWVGQVSAFSPATGEAEPMSLDSRGNPVLHLQSLVVEQRDNEHGNTIVRHNVCRGPPSETAGSTHGKRPAISGADRVVGGASHIGTAAEEQPSASREEEASTPWQQEEISVSDEGLVFFDGGSYSLGPVSLIQPHTLGEEQMGSHTDELGEEQLPDDKAQERDQRPAEEQANPAELEDDEIDPEPDQEPYTARTASEVEMCLAWGSDQRLRLKLLLSVAREDELDAEVLWMTLARETWEGLLEEPLISADQVKAFMPAAEAAAQLKTKPQLAPARLAGQWKLFDLCAAPVYEKDPVTGHRKRFYMYLGQELQQRWRPKETEPGDDGGTFWLPGEAFVEIHMLAVSEDETEHAAQGNGKTQQSSRGLGIVFGWMPKQGTLISMQRAYDMEGELQEVRSRTAVAGGWVGGTM